MIIWLTTQTKHVVSWYVGHSREEEGILFVWNVLIHTWPESLDSKED